jgi:hypothetical protein
MVVASLVMGWQQRGELLHEEQSGWLRQSQLEARQLAISEDKSRSDALPLTLGMILIAVAVGLVVLFW